VKQMTVVQDEMKQVQLKLNETAARRRANLLATHYSVCRQHALSEKQQTMACSAMSGPYDRIQTAMQAKKDNIERMKDEVRAAKLESARLQMSIKVGVPSTNDPRRRPSSRMPRPRRPPTAS